MKIRQTTFRFKFNEQSIPSNYMEWGSILDDVNFTDVSVSMQLYYRETNKGLKNLENPREWLSWVNSLQDKCLWPYKPLRNSLPREKRGDISKYVLLERVCHSTYYPRCHRIQNLLPNMVHQFHIYASRFMWTPVSNWKLSAFTEISITVSSIPTITISQCKNIFAINVN